jgi:NTE family protein
MQSHTAAGGRFLRFCLFSALLCAAAHVLAQQPEAPPRPKIGLVLGGGGARGFAHVGVLRWLEDNHIPVDCIAGTSAGGLIGGMYATGMSPAEIRDSIACISWDDVLRGNPAYRDMKLRRKEDTRDYPIKFEFGLKHGFSTPSGLNPAHELGLSLCRYCLPYSSLDTFDRLPTPFRCVATDMLTADQVVLKDGSMAQALRATMAIPGVFTLVERSGRTLADGGLVNNLPVDVAQGMGAQVVIAVEVSTPVYDPDSLTSLLGTVSQAASVMQERNVRENRKLASAPPNLLLDLRDDLKQFTSVSYTRWAELEQQAYDALNRPAIAARLRRFRVSDAEWQAYLAQRRSRRITSPLTPAFIECRVNGGSPAEERLIEAKLAEHCGKPLDCERLRGDLTGITGWGPYDSASYEKMERGGEEGLLVRVNRKSYGPPFLRPGLQMDGGEWDNVRFILGGRLTAIDSHGSEWRTDAGLGARTLLSVEYYRPLGPRGWFAAPRAFFDRDSRDLFENRVRVSEYHLQRTGIGFDLGFGFGRQTELRAGTEVAGLVQSLHTGTPAPFAPSGVETSTFLRYLYDSSDDPVIPQRGARVEGEGRWFFSSPGKGGAFGQAELNANVFKPLSKTASLFFLVAGGSTFGGAPPLADQFTLGGPLRMTGYLRDELRGSNFLLLGGGYLHQLSDLPGALGQKVYAGGWYEYGSAFDSIRAARYHHSVSAGIVADTVLGAMSIGGSWTDLGRTKLFFTLGRFF